MVVAGLDHGGKGQQAHQRHHGADDARRRGEQGAGDQGRYGHGAGDGAKRKLQAEEQAIENVRPLDDVAHEEEQGYRRQHVIVHDAEGVLRQQVEHPAVEEGLIGRVIGVETEADAHGHQREGDREAEQDDEYERAQHQDGDLGIGHLASPDKAAI